MPKFKLVSQFKPSGDQPQAIRELVNGLNSNKKHQVLLGVTGSGKTFTIANIIAAVNKPSLVISPNKILAAQLYSEFKSFFPQNAVEYFISYYDYYQPEAYVPHTDTYIEKDASINDNIDRLRLKATSSLLERNDVIIIASVSCIYGLGAPKDYKDLCVYLERGKTKSREVILQELIDIHYERNEVAFSRGKFRVKGDTVEVYPAYLDKALRIELDGDEIVRLRSIHPLTGETFQDKEKVYVYPARHFVTTKQTLELAEDKIKNELKEQLEMLHSKGKLLEAQRLEQRTNFDLEMMRETGFCHGIENYSRHLSGRQSGERPFCLLDYFPDDFLTIIDESHISIPQIGGMYEGDRSRKQTLVNYGFRLPSALDNRPLKFSEFESIVSQVMSISATPGPYELRKSKGEVVEQVIRPTGLIDPEVIIRPPQGQIEDLIKEIHKRVSRNERILVTTLTKKTAEDLAEYLEDKGIQVKYLHSDIDALTRIEILKDLRKGKFDVLVGINLLREGLDLPEVSLVVVLDADKEGFLRSTTSLIQVCGRAARNVNGQVILYAREKTGSMKRALEEMNRRRIKQKEYNRVHQITPKGIIKAVAELEEFQYKAKKEGVMYLVKDISIPYHSPKALPHVIKDLESQMNEAADALDYESAAVIRDKIIEIKDMMVRSSSRTKKVSKFPQKKR